MSNLYRWIDHHSPADLSSETLEELLWEHSCRTDERGFRTADWPKVLEVSLADEDVARKLVEYRRDPAIAHETNPDTSPRLEVVVNPELDRYGWGVR